LQHKTRNALCGLGRVFKLQAESYFCIHVAVLITQAKATRRNLADPSPRAMRHLENFSNPSLRFEIPLTQHRACVLVFDG
jgi:hypothetical protein